MIPALPASTVALLKRVPKEQRHPGLQLDKFSAAGEQAKQREALLEVCGAAADGGLLQRRRIAWQAAWSQGGAASFTATTVAPLALHLARASALENAGICLHPLYGFAYLPGSGLKGMARAFATTVACAPREEILAVFGNEPGARDEQAVGRIVFHDAWPVTWPRLIADIVNNHHGDYYGAKDGDNAHAPGDWENPVPVYFLAVAPGATFEFALAKRRGDVPRELIELARQWLAGALTELGAGAKTAAGYGAFKIDDKVAQPPSAVGQTAEVAARHADAPAAARQTFETTLELITPAFLAGASQEDSDCDLRGATLRGLLRWWWRTMHAGFVDVATLRRLEAAVWGDTKHGSPLRVTVERAPANSPPQAYDRKAIREMSPQEKSGKYGIEGCEPAKTTQGLWYASYGMDEKKKRRCYLAPGCKWTVRLAARTPSRSGSKGAGGLSADALLDQARAALWLLCRYGGVGSRGRKGFGSLAASLEQWSVDRCREVAQAARREFGCDGAFRQNLALSPSLEQALPVVEVLFSWPDAYWGVLDQVGFALEEFAQSKAHDPAKASLGLPRAIHGPRDDGPLKTREGRLLQDPAKWKRREWLDFPCRDPKTPKQNARHASPIHVHLEARDHGYLVRVMAMPAACLPDLQTSRNFLDEFLKFIENRFRRCSELDPPGSAGRPRSIGGKGAAARRGAATASPARPAVAVSASDWEEIDAVYLKRIGQAHLVELPDGKKVRVERGVPPSPPKKNGDGVKIYRLRSGVGECRWQPPPFR